MVKMAYSSLERVTSLRRSGQLKQLPTSSPLSCISKSSLISETCEIAKNQSGYRIEADIYPAFMGLTYLRKPSGMKQFQFLIGLPHRLTSVQIVTFPS
jgi:hypothetical protein